MLFNSFTFIFLFLPVVLIIYFNLTKNKEKSHLSKVFLVASSVFFYGWWNPIYIPLLILSIIINYLFSLEINKNKPNKKTIIFFGISFNLFLLSYYKYFGFIIENLNTFLSTPLTIPKIELPLAISFFTFQQIAFLVDTYKGYIKKINVLDYFTFITFFPQLIAGPIVHHKEMMPQFSNSIIKIISPENISKGLKLFSIGLFKKVVIADSFAEYANLGYNNYLSLNLIESWLTSFSYTLQLYFDFSGYSDMAIGLALFFNIKIPINFNSPYRARNIQEFWRKWHISLSNFLRDYVYIPLGGSKSNELRTHSNLVLTFILGGIWHGAGWSFIIWGFLNGIALVFHRIISSFKIQFPIILSWGITLFFINITWIFFRCESLEQGTTILTNMFNLNKLVIPEELTSYAHLVENYNLNFGKWLENINGSKNTLLLILFGLFISLYPKNSYTIIECSKNNLFSLIYYSIIFIIPILFLNSKTDFLYFNF